MRLGISLTLVSLLAAAILSLPALAAPRKQHVIVLGAPKKVSYSKAGDPSGALPGEESLKIRPLLLDDQIKEWTTGDSHDVTDRTFVVRRAIRLNDALPGDKPGADTPAASRDDSDLARHDAASPENAGAGKTYFDTAGTPNSAGRVRTITVVPMATDCACEVPGRVPWSPISRWRCAD